MDVSTIFNYCKVTDAISMGGQPTTNQFKLIKNAGKDVVIQLVVKEASYSPKDEAYHVREAGLEYEVMDISFVNPTINDVDDFMSIMQKHAGKNIYVHCAVGYCTSGLLSIYLMEMHNMTFEQAKENVLADWQPNPIWSDLIRQVANKAI